MCVIVRIALRLLCVLGVFFFRFVLCACVLSFCCLGVLFSCVFFTFVLSVVCAVLHDVFVICCFVGSCLSVLLLFPVAVVCVWHLSYFIVAV